MEFKSHILHEDVVIQQIIQHFSTGGLQLPPLGDFLGLVSTKSKEKDAL